MSENNGHKFAECSCGHHGCAICYGKIRICKVCEGINHSLTSRCCGHWIDPHWHEQIAKGNINYYNGKWHTPDDKGIFEYMDSVK